MIIKSPAGEFPITIDRFEVEDGDFIIVGQMGVWDARTHVPPGDFLAVLGKLIFSPSVLLYALRAPYLKQLQTELDDARQPAEHFRNPHHAGLFWNVRTEAMKGRHSVSAV